MMGVCRVREATQLATRRAVRGERLDVRGTVLLVERRVVLLANRRSEVLRAGTIQHAVVSRRPLQRVVVRTEIVVRAKKRVVVNRANVVHVDAAVIHARLTELTDRRSALHLTAKVRRPLMHLLDATKVLDASHVLGPAEMLHATKVLSPTKMLGSTKTSDVAATDVSTTETAATHVAATHMASPHVASSSTTVAVTGRQALQEQQ